MEGRTIEVTLISARDLDNLGFNTEAYANAWINTDSINMQQTPVDPVNGTNPIWNHCMRFTLDEGILRHSYLEIAIFTKSPNNDIEIGGVKFALEHSVEPGFSKSFTCPVQTPSENPIGILNISLNTKLSDQPQQQPYTNPTRRHTPYHRYPSRPSRPTPYQRYPSQPYPTRPALNQRYPHRPTPYQPHQPISPPHNGYNPGHPNPYQPHPPLFPPYQGQPTPYQAYPPIFPPYQGNPTPRRSYWNGLRGIVNRIVAEVIAGQISENVNDIEDNLGDGFGS